MKKKILFSLFSLLILNSSIFAADGCKNPSNSYDATYCTAKLFIESDQELNQTYNDLRKTITPSEKKSLLKAQLEWIKYRNNHCSRDSGAIMVDCNFALNKTRDAYLRDRLRECKTGHCQSDLIGATNF